MHSSLVQKDKYLDDKIEGVQLGVAGGAVGEDLGVLGIPPQRLGIVLHRIGPVSALEKFIAF